MLNQRIIIDRDSTTLQRAWKTPTGKRAFRKYKEIPTSNFIRDIKPISIILPQNTRFYKNYGKDTHLFITEYAPQMRTIYITINQESKWQTFLRWCETVGVKKDAEKFFKDFGSKYYGHHKFQLLFPYIIMITILNPKGRWTRMFAFLSQKSITNMSSMLYKIPMYNIQRNQCVCFSSSLSTEVYRMPLPDAIDNIFKSYFNGYFNSDYRYNIVSYRYKLIFNNYFTWAYLSHHDPFEILKQKLVKHQSIEKMIREIEERLNLRTQSNLKQMVEVF